MTKHEIVSKLTRGPDSLPQPQTTSYDSGYEHSVEHWFEVQRVLREAEDVVFDRPLKCDGAA